VSDAPVPLDRAEAARRLHVSERTIRRYARGGLLDEIAIGPRLKFVSEESVERMLRGGEDDAG
jgi:DNA-binding transcriptional MerR regulator